MNNLGPSIERIFGVLLILIGSFLSIVFLLMLIDEGKFMGSIMSDILMIFTTGFLPLYFGFKLYNGYDILRMKPQSSYTFDSMFTIKAKKGGGKERVKSKIRKRKYQNEKTITTITMCTFYVLL